MPLTNIEESKLIKLAQDGEFEAFEEIVSRYEKRAFKLALRILRQNEDAEDVVQETFLNVARNIKKFRGESSFHTWLTRIVTNNALKMLRNKKGFSTVSIDASPDKDDNEPFIPPVLIADWRDTPEQIARKKETGEILSKALDNIDEKYKFVFLLRDVEGLSIKDTSEALEISEANVKVRLLRARLMLRERLTEIYGDMATTIEDFEKHYNH
jgi:RNA polymerase sigma-70 factor, ECF subfamily